MKKDTARSNIKKAWQKWVKVSFNQKGGENMRKKYFKIVVRPESEFKTFKKEGIGEEKRVVRLAGKRRSGLWDTQAWLISKYDAHIEERKLIPDTKHAKYAIKSLASEPRWIRTNIFRARDRFLVP